MYFVRFGRVQLYNTRSIEREQENAKDLSIIIATLLLKPFGYTLTSVILFVEIGRTNGKDEYPLRRVQIIIRRNRYDNIVIIIVVLCVINTFVHD